ncbi:PIG-L family deacetylase [Candidatus Pelagibacter ubique]|nr:PIG-L family deacetylase [Candidatus Pelagibacter ubique]
MINTYKIVVAHPDDEILFFSSILKNSLQTIICFGPSEDKDVTIGRQNLKTQIPLDNIFFLDLPESNVQDTANWKKPQKTIEGIFVSKNSSSYKKNYDRLKAQLSKYIHYGETIYTHNPWGEYGHEEHIQVFRVIMALAKDLNLKVCVNSYISNKSYMLMTKEQHLLSSIAHIGVPNFNLTLTFKKLYQSNLCWTWHDDYCWPNLELFYEIDRSEKNIEIKNSKIPTYPLNMISGNYNTNIFKAMISKILPTKIKKLIKLLLKS